jgi:hypothetical protein
VQVGDLVQISADQVHIVHIIDLQILEHSKPNFLRQFGPASWSLEMLKIDTDLSCLIFQNKFWKTGPIDRLSVESIVLKIKIKMKKNWTCLHLSFLSIGAHFDLLAGQFHLLLGLAFLIIIIESLRHFIHSL